MNIFSNIIMLFHTNVVLLRLNVICFKTLKVLVSCVKLITRYIGGHSRLYRLARLYIGKPARAHNIIFYLLFIIIYIYCVPIVPTYPFTRRNIILVVRIYA